MASITIQLTDDGRGFPILKWSRDLNCEYEPGKFDADLEAPLFIAAFAAIDTARLVLARQSDGAPALPVRLVTIDGEHV